jgi:hypothetical protein
MLTPLIACKGHYIGKTLRSSCMLRQLLFCHPDECVWGSQWRPQGKNQFVEVVPFTTKHEWQPKGMGWPRTFNSCCTVVELRPSRHHLVKGACLVCAEASARAPLEEGAWGRWHTLSVVFQGCGLLGPAGSILQWCSGWLWMCVKH